MVPAVLGALIAVNSAAVVPHAGAELSRVGKSGVRAPVVTRTVLLVGDSVPQVLSAELADAAATRGYVVIRATAGGCPATAVQKVYSSGARFKTNGCPKVARDQDAKVAKFRPALVIWWSRYEVAPRLGHDGKILPLGSKAYWRAQKASFRRRVRALTKHGARVVAVQIERPGRALAERNPSEEGFLVGQTLLHRRDVVDAWNAFLASHKGPKVFSMSIDGLVCHDAAAACDDRLPNGETARPDGIHYSDTAASHLASQVFDAALRIAQLEPAS
jgi:SGNH domain (fused to AT3 domains)